MNTFDVVGAIGALLLVLAYFLLTTKRWTSHTLAYQLTNVIAATLLIVYNVNKSAHVGLFINMFWLTIAVAGISLHKKHSRKYKH